MTTFSAEHDERMNEALGQLAPAGTWLQEILHKMWTAKTTEEARKIAIDARAEIDRLGLWGGPRGLEMRPKPIAVCKAEHTKFQPTDGEWRCPKCDADVSRFYIDEGFGDSDCPALHKEDDVRCHACNSVFTGEALAKLLLKKTQLKLCPTCEGTGMVKR